MWSTTWRPPRRHAPRLGAPARAPARGRAPHLRLVVLVEDAHRPCARHAPLSQERAARAAQARRSRGRAFHEDPEEHLRGIDRLANLRIKPSEAHPVRLKSSHSSAHLCAWSCRSELPRAFPRAHAGVRGAGGAGLLKALSVLHALHHHSHHLCNGCKVSASGRLSARGAGCGARGRARGRARGARAAVMIRCSSISSR